MGIFISFGAGLGNFSSRRGKMDEVVHEINQRLALLSTPTRVVGWHHSIGNFVLETPKHNPREVADELSLALGTPYAALTINEVTSCLSALVKMNSPPLEPGVQWTRGIAFELRGRPCTNNLKPTPRAVFFRINNYAVGVDKRDPLTDSANSAKEDQAGGWSKISSDVTEQTGGIWTARSLARVKGTFQKAQKHLG